MHDGNGQPANVVNKRIADSALRVKAHFLLYGY
jgi:hypothetical protein